MDDQLQEYLDFAKGLAKQAGEIMTEHFNRVETQTTWKEDNSPVTVADERINRLVIDEVKKAYPDHGILGEEENYELDRDTLWVVDPIDGTAPYDLGMPISSFCLALVHKGQVLVSVVYDPFQDQLFHAIKGQGAYLNETKLSVPQGTDLGHKYVWLPVISPANNVDFSAVAAKLREKGVKTVSISTFAYMGAMIPGGKMMAAFMNYGSPWDAAAISLIIQEAGGKATDLAGKERRYNEWGDGILLTNGILHDEFLELIKEGRDG